MRTNRERKRERGEERERREGGTEGGREGEKQIDRQRDRDLRDKFSVHNLTHNFRCYISHELLKQILLYHWIYFNINIF